MGSDYYPIPWKALRYDTRLEGYVTDITGPQLEGAPKYSKGSDPDWLDDYDSRMHDLYGSDTWCPIQIACKNPCSFEKGATF
jgi:hypothetical protein